jgi:hypothetical protein
MTDEVNAITEPPCTSEPSFTAEPVLMKRQGYWADHEHHPYHRLNVETFIDEFCGWRALTDLINVIYDPVQKAFFIMMFQTGGRVSEVLLLRKNNFEILPKIIKVEGMRLLKQYRKLDGYTDPFTGKRRWHTELRVKFRKTFTIQEREPFSSILEKYLKGIHGSDVYLFPSPYSHSRRFSKTHQPTDREKRFSQENGTGKFEDENGQVPYTRDWAYKTIRQIDRLAPNDLKRRLGLNKVWLDDKGKKIADSLHLWLHWARSQRASQLVNDYRLEVPDLVEYFQWKDLQTALRYSKQGWHKLTDKMSQARVTYV